MQASESGIKLHNIMLAAYILTRDLYLEPVHDEFLGHHTRTMQQRLFQEIFSQCTEWADDQHVLHPTDLSTNCHAAVTRASASWLSQTIRTALTRNQQAAERSAPIALVRSLRHTTQHLRVPACESTQAPRFRLAVTLSWCRASASQPPAALF